MAAVDKEPFWAIHHLDIYEVKKKILSIASFIHRERQDIRKVILGISALLESAAVKSSAPVVELSVRYDKVVLMQEEYANVLKHAKRSVRPNTLQHNALSLEHFKRESRATSHGPSGVSPWDKTEFKGVLINSLESKLRLKLIFSVILHYSNMIRLAEEACQVSYTKKNLQLIRLCFQSLLLECYSSYYIAMACEVRVRRHTLTRRILPLFGRWMERYILSRHMQPSSINTGTAHRRYTQLSTAILTWRYRCIRYKRMARLTRGAKKCQRLGSLVHAFSAWMLAFVQHNTLRRSLQHRLSKSKTTSIHQTLNVDGNLVDILQHILQTMRQFKSSMYHSLLSPHDKGGGGSVDEVSREFLLGEYCGDVCEETSASAQSVATEVTKLSSSDKHDIYLHPQRQHISRSGGHVPSYIVRNQAFTDAFAAHESLFPVTRAIRSATALMHDASSSMLDVTSMTNSQESGNRSPHTSSGPNPNPNPSKAPRSGGCLSSSRGRSLYTNILHCTSTEDSSDDENEWLELGFIRGKGSNFDSSMSSATMTKFTQVCPNHTVSSKY